MMLISKNQSSDFDDELEICADRFGISFPEELVRFLRKYNGGETPNTTFSINGISSDVKAFYGLGRVKHSYSSIKMKDHGSHRYLPIALDSFGNDIVIDVNSGKVFFNDHEMNSISPLADSIGEFISKCNSIPVNPAMGKSVEERELELIQRGRGNVISNELRKMWQAEIDKYSSLHLEQVEL